MINNLSCRGNLLFSFGTFLLLSGVPNAFEIELICRKRIKENDPTPPAA
jgi:hypothetical protein